MKIIRIELLEDPAFKTGQKSPVSSLLQLVGIRLLSSTRLKNDEITPNHLFLTFNPCNQFKIWGKFDFCHIRPPKACTLTKIRDFKCLFLSWAELLRRFSSKLIDLKEWNIQSDQFFTLILNLQHSHHKSKPFCQNVPKIAQAKPTRSGKQNLGQNATSFSSILGNFH